MTITPNQIISLNGEEYIGGVVINGRILAHIPSMGDEIEFKSDGEILAGEVTECWQSGVNTNVEVSVY